MSRASREGSRQAWRQDRQGACPREAEAHQRTVCPDALYTSDAPTRPRRSARPGERSRSRLDARADPRPVSLETRDASRLAGRVQGMAQGYAERPAAHVARPREARLAHSLRFRARRRREGREARRAARAATPGVEPVGRAARCVARVAEGPAPGRGADERPLVARRAHRAPPRLFRVVRLSSESPARVGSESQAETAEVVPGQRPRADHAGRGLRDVRDGRRQESAGGRLGG